MLENKTIYHAYPNHSYRHGTEWEVQDLADWCYFEDLPATSMMMVVAEPMWLIEDTSVVGL